MGQHIDNIIKQRLYSGGIWVFGGKMLAFISGIIVNALLSRILTPENMGLYFLTFSLVTFSMMFSLLGMERVIVRIISGALALEQPARARQAVKYVLQFGLLSAIIVALILISGGGQFVSQKIFQSTLISKFIYLPAIWMVIYAMQSLTAESFRGFHDIRFATLFNGPFSSLLIVSALGYIFFTGRSMGIQQVLLIFISAYAVNLCLASFLLQRKTAMLEKSKERLITRSDLMKSSWLLYVTNIFLFFMSSGPLWVLALYSTKEHVAIYGAAARLMVLITTSLQLLKLTILPTIGHLYAKKAYEELEKVLRSSATLAGLPAILGLLLVILASKTILMIVYGQHYTAGYSALLVLSVANIINVFTGTPGALMVMASKEKFLMIFAFTSGTVGLGLCFLLVGSLDYVGIAIGQGSGLAMYNVLMMVYCRKKLSITTLMSFQELLNFGHKIRRIYTLYVMSKADFEKS